LCVSTCNLNANALNKLNNSNPPINRIAETVRWSPCLFVSQCNVRFQSQLVARCGSDSASSVEYPRRVLSHCACAKWSQGRFPRKKRRKIMYAGQHESHIHHKDTLWCVLVVNMRPGPMVAPVLLLFCACASDATPAQNKCLAIERRIHFQLSVLFWRLRWGVIVSLCVSKTHTFHSPLGDTKVGKHMSQPS
jgi:hypothetical protein